LFDRIFIGGKEQNQYTFTQNYYFVQGDNIEGSIDSRHFGLIAEKCIFGKILFKK
jgi:signal peptidase I